MDVTHCFNIHEYHIIIRAAFVCLFVCSPTPVRSIDGSSPNLLGVCRGTSELPLSGSFLKRLTGQRVKRHLFGADDTGLRPHRCKRHTASFAEHGVFCPAKGTWHLRVLIPSMGIFTSVTKCNLYQSSAEC